VTGATGVLAGGLVSFFADAASHTPRASHPRHLASNQQLQTNTKQTEKYGVFDCKPLAFIWAKFSEYTPDNTVMLDDLRRNFVMVGAGRLFVGGVLLWLFCCCCV
jgi:hypothetical protein